MRALSMAALALAAILANALPAAGHQWASADAQWIQNNPDFRSALGVHCCGPQDCFRTASAPAATPTGLRLTLPDGRTVDVPRRFKATYQSRNAAWWVCIHALGDSGAPTPRCVFRPSMF